MKVLLLIGIVCVLVAVILIAGVLIGISTMSREKWNKWMELNERDIND